MIQSLKRKYSHLSIHKKLMLVMGTFAVLILLIVAVATYGLLKGNLRMQTLCSNNLKLTQYINGMKEGVQEERAMIAALFITVPGSEDQQAALSALSEVESSVQDNIADYLRIHADAPVLTKARGLYTTEYDHSKQSVITLLEQGRGDQAREQWTELTRQHSLLMEQLQDLETQNNEVIQSIVAAAKVAFYKQFIYAVPILLITVFIFIDQRSRLKHFISDRIVQISEAAGQIADGHIEVALEVSSTDEIGVLSAAFNKMVEGIGRQVRVAESISNGDFTIKVPLRSEADILGRSLQKIAKDLNDTLLLVNQTANKVRTGADQVSFASEALASTTIEQAASVEELNASLTTISQQAEDNQRSVSEATQSVLQASEGVKDSHTLIQKLHDAMHLIGKHSEKVSKITKAIEEIATQTNILALNAAIEAAHAGSAGRGFAVVAEKVRSLAKSSDVAAKEAKDLIQQSISSVLSGQKLTIEAVAALSEVAKKAGLVEKSIQDIQTATAEQTMAIEHINQGLSEVSAAVQTNAATSQESSASSQELAVLAHTLQQELQKFILVWDDSDKSDSLELFSDAGSY